MHLLLGTAALAALPAQAQYYATDLNTPPFTPTMGLSVSGTFMAGVGTIANQPQALVWEPSANQIFNLTPSGYTKAYGLGISAGETVGQGVTTAGKTVALLWPAPNPTSVMNLNPTIGGVALSLSVANGISANQQVGYGQFSASGPIALLWNGTAASAVNLNPAGYVDSEAIGTSGTQQVGYADVTVSGNSHAMLWSGTAASAVDLHPTSGYVHSVAEAVSGGFQVGYAEPVYGNGTGPSQAFVWTGSAASAINLNPPGFVTSVALGVANGLVVGYGSPSTGGQEALLWRGSASNYINLSAFLPAGATNAQARSIDSSGNIIGYATVGGQTHAFLWRPAVAPAFANTVQNVTTVANLSYGFTFSATGSPAPTFSVTSGSLPPGLSLSAAGVVSGQPTQTGTYTATITASNGVAPSPTQNLTITVVPGPVEQMSTVSAWSSAGGYDLGNFTQGLDGNFYCAVGQGSFTQAGAGAVGEVTPAGALTILHTFRDGSISNDGADPNGLVQGPDGSLYGTTQIGGSAGSGTFFKIAQGVTTILHNFQDGSVSPDGYYPSGALLPAGDGSFYGVTMLGGTVHNYGTVYKVTTDGTVTLLHLFGDGSVPNDGASPAAGLIQGADGNLYGTTAGGGSASRGTAYRITPQGVETVLHAFGDGSVSHDGLNPSAPLVQGLDGNFYGTTVNGGTANKGTIFRMTPQGAVTILHSFNDGTIGNDGTNDGSSAGGLVLGPDGNFYGVTEYGGSAKKGTLYQISPQGVMLILHSFGDGTISNEGYDPAGSLILAADGNYYGNAGAGGSNFGTLFKFSIQSAPVFSAISSSVNGVAGTAYNFAFIALGSPAPTFTLTSGALPPGLSLSSSGQLTGVPTQAGTYTGVVTASNGVGTAATQSFTIIIAQPTDTPTLPVWGEIVLAGLLVIATARQVPGRPAVGRSR